MSALPALLAVATVPAISHTVSAGLQLGAGIGGYMQSRREAKLLEEIGFAEAEERRREGRKLIGAQRARYAKAGVVPDVGTPLQVAMEAAETTELNALREAFRGRRMAEEAQQQGMALLGHSILGALSSGLAAHKAWPRRKMLPLTPGVATRRPPEIAQPRGRYFL